MIHESPLVTPMTGSRSIHPFLFMALALGLATAVPVLVVAAG